MLESSKITSTQGKSSDVLYLAYGNHYYSEKYVILILFLSNSASRRTNHLILVAYKNHMLHGNLCEDRVFSCILQNTFFVGTRTIFR